MALSHPTLELALQPRLMRSAEMELSELYTFMQTVELVPEQHDLRVLRTNEKKPTSAQLYELEFQQEPRDIFVFRGCHSTMAVFLFYSSASVHNFLCIAQF